MLLGEPGCLHALHALSSVRIEIAFADVYDTLGFVVFLAEHAKRLLDWRVGFAYDRAADGLAHVWLVTA